MNLDHLTDESSICALASGRGGGIALIRVSGSRALPASNSFSLPIEIVGLPAMPTTER